MTNTWRSGTEPGYQAQERAHSSCAACTSLSDSDKVTVKVRGRGAAVVYPTHCMHAISMELGPPQTHRHTCTIYISKQRGGFSRPTWRFHLECNLCRVFEGKNGFLGGNEALSQKHYEVNLLRTWLLLWYNPHSSVKPALMHENRLTRLLKVALFLQNVA